MPTIRGFHYDETPTTAVKSLITVWDDEVIVGWVVELSGGMFLASGTKSFGSQSEAVQAVQDQWKNRKV